MNLQGDFEGLNLTGIFQLLHNEQKTGFLKVTGNGNESRVYFNQGTIVYATSSLKKNRLGFLMIKDGIISDRQLKEALGLARNTRQALGKILVYKGYISVKILEKYNIMQVETIIYDLLFWKKGRFEYKDAALNLKGMITTRINPIKLILEASRRVDEMPVTTGSIPVDRVPQENVPADHFTPVIMFFDDIFQMIHRHIHQEIGNHTGLLFKKCKQDIDPLSRVLLAAYHPCNSREKNIRAVFEALEMEKITRSQSLVNAFSRYCTALLNRIGDILGPCQADIILNEIKTTSEHIKKYPSGSGEREKIIHNLNSIIQKIKSEHSD